MYKCIFKTNVVGVLTTSFVLANFMQERKGFERGGALLLVRFGSYVSLAGVIGGGWLQSERSTENIPRFCAPEINVMHMAYVIGLSSLESLGHSRCLIHFRGQGVSDDSTLMQRTFHHQGMTGSRATDTAWTQQARPGLLVRAVKHTQRRPGQEASRCILFTAFTLFASHADVHPAPRVDA